MRTRCSVLLLVVYVLPMPSAAAPLAWGTTVDGDRLTVFIEAQLAPEERIATWEIPALPQPDPATWSFASGLVFLPLSTASYVLEFDEVLPYSAFLVDVSFRLETDGGAPVFQPVGTILESFCQPTDGGGSRCADGNGFSGRRIELTEFPTYFTSAMVHSIEFTIRSGSTPEPPPVSEEWNAPHSLYLHAQYDRVVVPEPGTAALLALGLAGLGAHRRIHREIGIEA